jgi:hypothetical protein
MATLVLLTSERRNVKDERMEKKMSHEFRHLSRY